MSNVLQADNRELLAGAAPRELLLASMGTIAMCHAREPQAKQVTEDELPVVFAVHAANALVMRQGMRHEYAAGPDRQ